MRTIWTRTVAAALLTVAGCGGSDGIPAEKIADEWHRAECGVQVRCGEMPDVDTCVASTYPRMPAQMAADLASGKMSYNPAGGQQFVSAMNALSCDSAPNGAEWARVNEAFAVAFQGAVPNGGACSDGEQCVSGKCDVPSYGDGCPQGTCGPAPTLIAPGEPCTPLNGGCAGENLCSVPDPTTGKSTCQPPPGAGEPCNDEYAAPCAAGLECIGGMCAQRPAPRPPVPAGAACTPGGPSCEDGTFCDPSGTCRPQARLGEPCSNVGDYIFSPCLGSLACDATKTCRLPPRTTAVCP